MPNDLSAFIDLQPQDAREQWERIRARGWPVGKERQENFLPVEVLFCFGLSQFDIPLPQKSNERNAVRPTTPAYLLADVFKRPPRSLNSKIQNLEGSRPHAGTGERELNAYLKSHLEVFLRVYRIALFAARETGFDEEQVPDISYGSADAIVRQLDDEDAGLSSDEKPQPGSTTRNRDVKTRIGQGVFRRKLMRRWQGRCAVTGSDASLFLRASHIKPWADSSDAERLDPNNGLLLIAEYDAAFDARYITFDDEGRLEARPELTETLAKHLGIDINARLREKPNKEMQKYLKLHRALSLKRSKA